MSLDSPYHVPTHKLIVVGLSTTSTSLVYLVCGGYSNAFVTENVAKTLLSAIVDLHLVRMYFHPTTNTRPNPFNFYFRDDGISTASITIPTGTASDIDSGIMDVIISKGSLCDVLFDGVTAGVGNIMGILSLEFIER